MTGRSPAAPLPAIITGRPLFPFATASLILEFDHQVEAAEAAAAGTRLIAVVPTLPDQIWTPHGQVACRPLGTLAEVLVYHETEAGTIELRVRGIRRLRVAAMVRRRPYPVVRPGPVSELGGRGLSVAADRLRATFAEWSAHRPSLARGVRQQIARPGLPAARLADLAASCVTDPGLALALLEDCSARSRLEALATWFAEQQSKRTARPSPHAASVAAPSLADQLAALSLPPPAREIVARITADQSVGPGDHAAGPQAHLRLIASLPWGEAPQPPPHSLEQARAILDASHSGMVEVKAALLDALAGLFWWHRRRAEGAAVPATPPLKSILLVGPKGTGKTSILQSFAAAAGRSLHVIQCGGLTEAARLIGFERTYANAREGAVVRAVRSAGTTNMVIALDEIDKIHPSASGGDPRGVLLALVDDSQRHAFVDVFLEAPLDLTQTIFVATANNIEDVDETLRDRFQVVELRSYSLHEKIGMARAHLIPALFQRFPIDHEISVTDGALAAVITDYTDEGGVRGLATHLTTLVQRSLAALLEADPGGEVVIDQAAVRRHLGPRRNIDRPVPLAGAPGYATMLFSGPTGGSILPVQATLMPGGRGRTVLTGQVNSEHRESLRVAMSYLRAHAAEHDLVLPDLHRADIHVHVDMLGVPKGGPSGCLAFVSALYSVLSARSLPAGVAMTGEISLGGGVLPVGAIADKSIACQRAGFHTLLIPLGNVHDLAGVPADVRADLDYVPVDSIAEAIRFLFAAGTGAALTPASTEPPVVSATQPSPAQSDLAHLAEVAAGALPPPRGVSACSSQSPCG